MEDLKQNDFFEQESIRINELLIQEGHTTFSELKHFTEEQERELFFKVATKKLLINGKIKMIDESPNDKGFRNIIISSYILAQPTAIPIVYSVSCNKEHFDILAQFHANDKHIELEMIAESFESNYNEKAFLIHGYFFKMIATTPEYCLTEKGGRVNLNEETKSGKDELIQKVEDFRKTSGCFIATACYGDYDSKEVMILRRFRDEHLSSSLFGRKFISTYYKYSPKLASYISQSDILKRNIRKYFLAPIISVIDKTYK